MLILANFQQFVKKHKEKILLFIIVMLISLFSFAIGYITAKLQEKEPLKIEIQDSTNHP